MKVLQRYYLLFFTVTSSFHVAVGSRKYDIALECQKLYKEDLNTVLARFRKTPEYLKIINDKHEALQMEVEDTMRHTLYFWHDKVRARVEQRLAVDKSSENTANTNTETNLDAQCRKSFPVDDNFGTWLHRDLWGSGRKAVGQGSQETTKSGIELLDGYESLRSHLTVPQKNGMKDLGFELAGDVIHAIIGALSNDDLKIKSTKLPGGGDNGVTTTQHVTKHEVTTKSDAEKIDNIADDSRMDAVRMGNAAMSLNDYEAVHGADTKKHKNKIPEDKTKRRTPEEAPAAVPDPVPNIALPLSDLPITI